MSRDIGPKSNIQATVPGLSSNQPRVGCSNEGWKGEKDDEVPRKTNYKISVSLLHPAKEVTSDDGRIFGEGE